MLKVMKSHNDVGGTVISATEISDTTSCDIRTPDITSDIDSDIGGVLL